MEKNVTNQQERNNMYQIIESFIMRRIVVQATPKNYNNLFTSLILNKIDTNNMLRNRLVSSTDSTNYVPSDADLSRGFKESKLYNLQAKGILYLIECSIRPSNSATSLLGFSNYSLEHLMPKKWRNNWPQCTTIEQEKERDTKLLTLGNLAIITQSLNASIRDSSWIDKKIGKNNKPGLNQCAIGINSLADVLNKNVWNEAEIENHAQFLCKKALQIWKI